MKKKYKKPEIKWLAMDTSYGVMQDASPSFDFKEQGKGDVDIHAKEQHFHSYSVWE